MVTYLFGRDIVVTEKRNATDKQILVAIFKRNNYRAHDYFTITHYRMINDNSLLRHVP